MGEFKPKCPVCGGGLSVVQLSWIGKMPLRADGFSFDEADTSATDNEVVKCNSCGKEFSLSELQER